MSRWLRSLLMLTSSVFTASVTISIVIPPPVDTGLSLTDRISNFSFLQFDLLVSFLIFTILIPSYYHLMWRQSPVLQFLSSGLATCFLLISFFPPSIAINVADSITNCLMSEYIIFDVILFLIVLSFFLIIAPFLIFWCLRGVFGKRE